MNYLLQDQLTQEQAQALGEFVEHNPHCHLFQHPDWVWVSGRTRRWQYLYFWGEEAGEIKVSALVSRMRLPGLGWSRDRVERGPVCAEPALLREATAELARLLQTRGSVSLTVNPYWAQPEAERIEADLASLGFSPFMRWNGPHVHSLVIDLTPDETEIFYSFRNATRRALKKAQQMGLTVAPAVNEGDIDTFYRLFKHMAVAKGIPSVGRGHLMRLWRRFLADQEHGICLMARYHGEVVSGHIELKHGTQAE
jgi:lipid II:glycine glycyltransferase (peptidoglycan interpeptide bridge formation enzyme)